MRLQVRVEALEAKVAQQAEELHIKDARMEQIDPRHRPHYPPEERLRILEQRAAFGWSQEYFNRFPACRKPRYEPLGRLSEATDGALNDHKA